MWGAKVSICQLAWLNELSFEYRVYCSAWVPSLRSCDVKIVVYERDLCDTAVTVMRISVVL